MSRVVSRELEPLEAAVVRWKADGASVVTTNGCFDILHAGHIRLLMAARALGDRLVVGLNSDTSVRQLKGEDRPVVLEASRAATLAALPFVDWVQIFEQSTPDLVLETVRPDVHVKGGDYDARALPEYELIATLGGRVEIVPEVPNTHTSDVLAAYKDRLD